jgi:hypothetical protein
VHIIEIIYIISIHSKKKIKLLIAKSNQGYEIVIPKFIFNNDKYVKLNRSGASGLSSVRCPDFLPEHSSCMDTADPAGPCKLESHLQKVEKQRRVRHELE